MNQNTNEARTVRIERLKAARRSDSAGKRVECLGAIERLLESGVNVTHTAMSLSAGVSRWFTYNCPEVRLAIERAAGEQNVRGLDVPPSQKHNSASNASLRTDLALLAAENGRLKEQNNKLRARLQVQLGEELTTTSHSEFLVRIDGLITANDRMSAQLDAANDRLAELSEENVQLSAELEGKTIALRRLMHAKNA